MKIIRQSGFSMAEIIIAIVLIGIVTPSIALLMSTLTQLNDRSVDTVSVNSLAENKIESLRSKGFNGVNVGTVDFSSELPSTLPSPRTASYTVANESSSLKSIVVTISAGSRSTQFKTYLGELGVGQY